MLRKICLVGAVGAIALSPVLAQAETRGHAPIEGESAIGGQSPIVFLAGIAAVAAAIVFLASDDAQHITGIEYNIDGGSSAR